MKKYDTHTYHIMIYIYICMCVHEFICIYKIHKNIFNDDLNVL